MKYVIFDFNGTILDDTDVCLKAENEAIAKYLPSRAPLTRDEYLQVFTFPVKSYYEKIGFTFDEHSYEEIGDFWFKRYCELKDEYAVYEGVIDILESNHKKGFHNILLSVSKKEEMLKQLDELGIAAYFDEVLGIDHIYATSKIEIAKDWIKDKDPQECIMIGDTLHDLECARAMKVECILVANGHQAKNVLLKEYDRVVDDIREICL